MNKRLKRWLPTSILFPKFNRISHYWRCPLHPARIPLKTRDSVQCSRHTEEIRVRCRCDDSCITAFVWHWPSRFSCRETSRVVLSLWQWFLLIVEFRLMRFLYWVQFLYTLVSERGLLRCKSRSYLVLSGGVLVRVSLCVCLFCRLCVFPFVRTRSIWVSFRDDVCLSVI